MRTVYEIVEKLDDFQAVQLDDEQLLANVHFDGTPIKESWNIPLAYIPEPTVPVGDFWGCPFAGGLFAVTKQTASKLASFLQDNCEQLPIAVEDLDEELLVCHTTNIVDCLDLQSSLIDETNWIQEYVFHSDRLGPAIFKLPQSRKVSTYCLHDDDVRSSESFKSFVEKNGLTGLRFKEVWSDSA